MVLEVMGRYPGWIAPHAGIAGGGDIILIPEIPFRYESICAKISEREQQGKKFTLLVVAEGACERGRGFVGATDEKNREARLGGIGGGVAGGEAERTRKERRRCRRRALPRAGGTDPLCRLG